VVLEQAAQMEIVMDEIVERRALRERRLRDLGPPKGCDDRRREIERRLPVVAEYAISDAEWKLFFGATACR
jgi:hypothetical protein